MPKRVRRGAAEQYANIEWQRVAFVAAAVILSVLTAKCSFETVQTSWRSAREVVDKSRSYEDLAAENRRLTAEENFLTTPEGMEFAVRADLGYISEGEQPLGVSVAECAHRDVKFGDRLRTSISRMHTNTMAWARETNDVICCMLGLWKPAMPEPENPAYERPQ